jgi:hypothetical protein
MMDAMEEKLSMPSNGCPKMISLMKLAQSIELEDMIMASSAPILLFAEIVTHMSHALFLMNIKFTMLNNLLISLVNKL